VDRSNTPTTEKPQVKLWCVPQTVHQQLLELIMTPPPPPPEVRKTAWERLIAFIVFVLNMVVGRSQKQKIDRVTNITDPYKGSDITLLKTGEGIRTAYKLKHAGNKPTAICHNEQDAITLLQEVNELKKDL
jgi:hypothetical protein